MLAGAGGCRPNLGAPPSAIDSLRMLAFRGTPAEATPGTMVTYASLLVDVTGERADLAATMDWAFCSDPKPLSDLQDVNPECFVFGKSYLTELTAGTTPTGALPPEACSLFGPDTPPAMPGMPAGRPADPDPSGGYYQPVRVILQCQGAGATCMADASCCSGSCQANACVGGTAQTVLGVEESRITCGLPGASSMTLATFSAEYRPNTNPTITSVEVAGHPETPPSVPAGQTVTLTTSWPTCAEGTTSCGGAEAYALYDEQTQAITPVCEAMTVSWFSNAGAFAADRSGPDAGTGIEIVDAGADGGAPVVLCDAPSFAQNTWTAPTTTGTALVWAVLRDDRGGVAWQRISIAVQ